MKHKPRPPPVGYNGRKVVSDTYGEIISQECSICRRMLPADAFTKHKGLRSGRSPECKECLAARSRERYRKDPIPIIVRGIIARSEKRGIFCDLTVDDVRAVLADQAGRCFYTGLPFGDIGDSTAPSIDRIDPARGYTRSNIVLCHRAVNVMKLDHPVGEFLLTALTIARNIDAIRSDHKIAPYFVDATETAGTVHNWTRDVIETSISTGRGAIARLSKVEADFAETLRDRDRTIEDLRLAVALRDEAIANIDDTIYNLTDDRDAAIERLAEAEADLRTTRARAAALESDIAIAESTAIAAKHLPSLPDVKASRDTETAPTRRAVLLRLCTSPDTIVSVRRW